MNKTAEDEQRENEAIKIKLLLEAAGSWVESSFIPGVIFFRPALKLKRQNNEKMRVCSLGVRGDYTGQVNDGNEWMSADFVKVQDGKLA